MKPFSVLIKQKCKPELTYVEQMHPKYDPLLTFMIQVALYFHGGLSTEQWIPSIPLTHK